MKTLYLGTFPEKWCQPRRQIKYNRRGLNSVDILLITNLASKMVAELSFQTNLEFTERTFPRSEVDPAW